MKPKKFEVMPWLFLVKINKEEQKAFKEKVSKNSPFFKPVGTVFNSRNMEHGEIVQIGDQVKGTDKCWSYDMQEGKCEWGIYGWENCKVGDILIFHHTIEQHETSEDNHAQYWVFDDETYNYYVVDYFNCRGFYDGIKVTPHPNFVFLKNIPAFEHKEDVEVDAAGNVLHKHTGGLIYQITNWNDNPSNIAQKSEAIKEHIESLAKMKNRTDEVQKQMELMEEERNQLNRKSQKKMFLPYRVAAVNRKLERDFGCKIPEGSVLFCFNKAAAYVSNFQDKEYSYLICQTDHVGLLVNPEFDTYEQTMERQSIKEDFNKKHFALKIQK